MGEIKKNKKSKEKKEASVEENVDIKDEIEDVHEENGHVQKEAKKRQKKKMKVKEEDVADENDDEDAAKASTVVDEDYQKEFKVLGQQDFSELKKIRVVSSWVKQAKEFPADIAGDNLRPLEEIKEFLSDSLLERVQKELKHWFPVQRAVLPDLLSSIDCPPVLRRRDVAISAPTGSGKTLCYVLPILAAVKRPKSGISSIVVVPVQALVKQIITDLARFNTIGAKVVGLSGSDPFEKERRRLLSSQSSSYIDADIIVATPSRLVEHILDPTMNMDLSRLRFIIADEADRMRNVRQEWLEVVETESEGLGTANTILDFVRKRGAPQKILLSATLSRDIEQLEKWNLHRPRLFRASAEEAHQVDTSAHCVLPSQIEHVILECPLKFHPLLLYRDIVQSGCKKVLVFTNQKMSSLRLCKLLTALAGDQFQVEQLTADLFGKRRYKFLERFRKGTTRVLICSDYLSRGIDVEGIDCVVNYDLPHETRLFIHRAGRTARAGMKGRLVSITEKEPRRLFVKVLKKGNLWKNVEEKTLEEAEFEEDLDRYRSALEKVKKEIETSEQNDKNGQGKEKNEYKNGGYSYAKKNFKRKFPFQNGDHKGFNKKQKY